MPNILEIREKHKIAIEDLEKTLGSFPSKSGDSGEPVYDIPEEKRGEVKEKIEKAKALGKELKEAQGVENDLKSVRLDARDFDQDGHAKNGGSTLGGGEKQAKTLGEQFTGLRKDGAPIVKGKEYTLDLDVKTLMTRGTGYAPQILRNGRLVPFVQAPITLLDRIPTVPTSQAGVKYMQETTYTNNAAPTAEGGAYPEAALAFTEVSAPIQKIAVFLPVTDEQLEDVEGLAAMLDNRLELMIRQKAEDRLINGTGTTPDVQGILNVSGIQSTVLGSDTRLDKLLKMIVSINASPSYSHADTIAINPADAQTILLSKDSQGRYLLGGPIGPGVTDLWGVDMFQVPRMPAGTVLAGDFGTYSEMDVRRDVTITITNSHGTYFTQGIQVIRADIRIAYVWYRPVAFHAATGF